MGTGGPGAGPVRLGGSNLMIYHRSIHFSRPGEGTNSWTGGRFKLSNI